MNAAWEYFWPIFAAGLVIGAFTGWWFHRQRPGRYRQWPTYGVGFAIALAATLSWHSFGGADRLTGSIERTARTTLDYYELPRVGAQVAGAPVRREVALSGPADDFQRTELLRIMNEIPGVDSVVWQDAPSAGKLMLPLIFEAAVVAALGFVLGLLLAQIAESRRRANAEWRW